MKTNLRFLGAFDTVTGSRTLITHRQQKYLVDCGLFQGPPELRQRNREPFEIPPKDIKAVFLTHAHLDHCGYLPRLFREGFRGPVYCAQGTLQLADVILRDAAHLEEETASFARRTGYSHHENPEPLFTLRDAERVFDSFRVLKRHELFDVDDGMSVKLIRSGHLIGSSFLQFRFGKGYSQKGVTFSGDLGNYRSMTLKGPENIDEPGTLILESTYGKRLHSPTSSLVQLGDALSEVIQREGVAVIPAFAVGRSQEIIYLIAELERLKRIPPVPVILDSPMAKRATEIFLQRQEDHVFDHAFGHSSKQFFPENFRITESTDESMLASMMDGPAIIISASGMLSGGRILHHLKRRLPDARNTVIFSGYQAEGSKGRFLQEQGSIEGKIRIHHQEVTVAASIKTIDSLSSHADYEEMIAWLKANPRIPERILLNHGDLESQATLKSILKERLGCRVFMSSEQKEWDI